MQKVNFRKAFVIIAVLAAIALLAGFLMFGGTNLGH